MNKHATTPKPEHDEPAAALHRLVVRGLFGIGIVLLAGFATYVLISGDRGPGSSKEPPASFELDLSKQMRIDPQLIKYQQMASIDLTLQKLRGIASGPQDKIYVAGDRAIHVFAADGQRQDEVNFDSQPTCLAVAGPEQAEPGRLYVATSTGITTLGVDHQVLASWPLPAENVVLTSMAVAGDNLFIADAGNRVVWRFSTSGELLGQIGKPDASRQIPDFVITSSYFDIVAGSEGLLYCVNPGKLQISTFSFEGDLGNTWGAPGTSLADFFGCCNPSHLARLADGRFVTSEKGIPRIKVYTATGELESVVAGPEQLGISQQSLSDPRQGIDEPVFDIAVDSRGRVLVLDQQTRTVRIFAPKNQT